LQGHRTVHAEGESETHPSVAYGALVSPGKRSRRSGLHDGAPGINAPLALFPALGSHASASLSTHLGVDEILFAILFLLLM